MGFTCTATCMLFMDTCDVNNETPGVKLNALGNACKMRCMRAIVGDSSCEWNGGKNWI